MACKGYKHPADCKCRFPYGNPHPESNLPRKAANCFSTFKANATRYYEAKTKNCPHCRELIYYKTFSSGKTGSYVFGRENLRHKCPATPHNPFYEKTRPRLRQILEQYQKEGWLPLFKANIKIDILGTWLNGITFSTPTERIFKINNSYDIDLTELIYFFIDTEGCLLKLRFFDLTKDGFVEVICEIS